MSNVWNFRVDKELGNAIDTIGRVWYPVQPKGKSKLSYDRSQTVKDILAIGLEQIYKGNKTTQVDKVKRKLDELRDLIEDL